MTFYRLLLHLYPSSYRAEYGDEMSAIFAQERRRTGGLAATCGLWLATIGEVFSNAASGAVGDCSAATCAIPSGR